MYYILKISTKAFIIVQDNSDIIITSDYKKATKYNTVGEAMKTASEVNDILGTHIVKFESIG